MLRAMVHTQIDETLARSQERHADDPLRVDVLARARRFKTSWIELAEALSQLRRTSHWRTWGYSSFEDYTRKELHLRPETVDKLTGSYTFLQHRAPEVLGRDGVSTPIPSFQSIDFLRRAEEREAAPPEALDEIRRRVLDDAAPLGTLARKYREVAFPIDTNTQRLRELSQLRQAAKRLDELLAQGTAEALPPDLVQTLRPLLAQTMEHLEDASPQA